MRGIDAFLKEKRRRKDFPTLLIHLGSAAKRSWAINFK